MGGSDVHDMSYYGKCMIGGILMRSYSHGSLPPRYRQVQKAGMETVAGIKRGAYHYKIPPRGIVDLETRF
jgi:hypothetical protein